MESKLTLKLRILNEIDNQPRGYAEILAKIAGYANGSNLKKVLKDEKKEFDKFNGLVELVKYLFNEDEQKLMEDYSKELDPNNKSARYMLEYLSCNRLLDSMKELIERMLVCKNKESIEYAKAYSIHYEWQMNYHTLDVNDYLENIREFKATVNEIKVYLKLLRCHALYLKKNHKMALETSQDIKDEVEEIKEEYIKNAYSTKFNEIESYIYLRVQNKPEQAREKAKMVLEANIGKTFNGYSHYTIGCSYFFQSYEKAKDHFIESMEIYKSIDRESAVNDVMEISQLLDIVWDKDVINIINPEYRVYWILKKSLNHHLELHKDNMDLEYYYLLKGMQEDNTELLMLSMIQFLKRGDAFFANLPRIELIKRNYSQMVIDELINFHLA